jgi:predicted ATP-binding protein involved in virulence
MSTPIPRHRVRVIRVEGLFGKYNHTVKLMDEARVTLVHGPNGVGKTSVMRLLQAAANGDMDEAAAVIPFDRLTLELDGAASPVTWTKVAVGVERIQADVSVQPVLMPDMAAPLDEVPTFGAETTRGARRRFGWMRSRLNKLLLHKSVELREHGMVLVGDDGRDLPWSSASGGERRLVRLMVTAFMQAPRGSLVVFDEPEKSMHVVWQQQIVPMLLYVAKARSLDFVLVTHSPDIIGPYVELEVGLSGRAP